MKEIITLYLKEKNYKEIKLIFDKMLYADIALLLEKFSLEKQVQLFRLISKEKAAEVFSYLDLEQQKNLLDKFTDLETKDIIEDLYIDDAVDFIEEMPANVVEKILSSTNADTRNMINSILQYQKDSAGSIMTVEYVELSKDMSVRMALDKIKKVGIDKETIYTCYVVENKKLLGIVSAKKLLISSDDMLIEQIMKTNFITVKTSDDKEYVSNLFIKYGFIAIPVIDSENCMVGIVTFDDGFNVLNDELNEDISKMNALFPSEESYFKTSVFKHAKNRIAWLLILMLSATITGTIITRYEATFAAIPILVAFIPMLMDTGGNCGSQSSTLVIRGIAVNEIDFRDFFKVLFKEFRVSILVGIVLGIVNGVRIVIMYHDFMLALLIAITLVLTVIISKLIGSILPLLAVKLKLDPAIMAAPLITTIVDTLSIIIYFNIATALFNL